MRVVKVLNNSLVLALDDEGNESILMGKGIGFHKAAGYEFDTKEVEKVFVLHDRSVSRSIIRLAAEIDNVYFEISKSIIDHAITKYRFELLDSIYLSLTDHLAFAVKRFRSGIVIPNYYLTELRRFNPDEYEVGAYAVRLLKQKLLIDIPMDEAGHVAFQFINAQKNVPNREKNKQVYELTDEVLSMIKYSYQIVFDELSHDYGRFIGYVRRFAQRTLSNQQFTEDPSDRIWQLIREHCPGECEVVEKISDFILSKYDLEVTGSEKVYLALQIRQYLFAVEGETYC